MDFRDFSGQSTGRSDTPMAPIPTTSSLRSSGLSSAQRQRMLRRTMGRAIRAHRAAWIDTNMFIGAAGIRTEARFEAQQRTANLYKTENRRSYSGYGAGNALENLRDKYFDQDWERRELASLPRALWAYDTASRYWPGWKPSSALFHSFGDDMSHTAGDPGYRTVHDLINSGQVARSHLYGRNAKRGGTRLEVDVNVEHPLLDEGDNQRTYQVLPDGRLRQVIRGPWNHYRRLYAAIDFAKSADAMPGLAKQIFHYFHPKGIPGAIGKTWMEMMAKGKDPNELDPAFRPNIPNVSKDEFHPIAQKLLGHLRRKWNMLRAGDDNLEEISLGLNEHVDSANYVAQMIRATHIPGWAQVLEFNRAFEQFGYNKWRRSELPRIDDEETFATRGVLTQAERMAGLGTRSAGYSSEYEGRFNAVTGVLPSHMGFGKRRRFKPIEEQGY